MLREEVAARIRRDGPIPVRDFLALALERYYASGPEIGAQGDFYTSANVSLFPRALRRFVDAARERLPGARVVEIGGGTGEVAQGMKLDGLTIVEPSAALAERQRARGLHVVPSLAELDQAPTIFLANEVLDALPVHRVLATPDGLREGYVGLRDGQLVEVPGELSSPALEDAANRLAPLLPEGHAAEVCLDARGLLAQMARAAPKAIALFIDYGGTTSELYGEHRPQGSLRGFQHHRVTDWFDHPGAQDVTADVDFDHVQRVARLLGFEPAGYRLQGEFLGDLGLVDDMMRSLEEGNTTTYMAAKGLLLPGGMGERFKALCLVRGVPAEPPLRGFRREMPLA